MKIAVIGKTTDNISLDKLLMECKPSSIIITNQITNDMEKYLWDLARNYSFPVDYIIVDSRPFRNSISDPRERIKEARRVFCEKIVNEADRIIVYADYSYFTKPPVLLLDDISKQIIALAEKTNVSVEVKTNDLHYCFQFSICEADCKPRYFTIRLNSKEYAKENAEGIAIIKAKIKYLEFIDNWGSYNKYDFKLLIGNQEIDTTDIVRWYEHQLKLYTGNNTYR